MHFIALDLAVIILHLHEHNLVRNIEEMLAKHTEFQRLYPDPTDQPKAA